MTRGFILLAEGDGPQRDVVVEFLRGRGFDVAAFASAWDAVHWVQTNSKSIDAAIVDWHLPGVGGKGVVTALRAQLPELPIIVVAGSPLSAAERACAMWTVAARKPFSLRSLFACLESLLAKRLA